MPELWRYDWLQLVAAILDMASDESTPAHPAARLITELSNRAVDRQIAQLTNLDLKASFLGGAAFALLAGFLTALATRLPASERTTDFAGATFIFIAATLACVGYTWWPRPVDAPPHPRGLRERHWMDPEESVLRAVADAIATTYDDNTKVESKKVRGIRWGIVALAFAVALGSIDILLITGGK